MEASPLLYDGWRDRGGGERGSAGASAPGAERPPARLAGGVRRLQAPGPDDGGAQAPGAGRRRAPGRRARPDPANVRRGEGRVYAEDRRAAGPRRAGLVSGGSVDPGDASLLETALREAEEEVDLRRDLVEVVGEMEDMYVPRAASSSSRSSRSCPRRPSWSSPRTRSRSSSASHWRS
ncbi:NUDIX domain-containing protein [Rubrobacter marinus]|uniref:NUDIX domain-containing protein n=1 Tax=Rubrobacter marinus TaxID=2653852 RepID=UPI002B1BD35D|nr:NUDIX domain-containing protein [Rubrobacter marinus]